MVICRHASESIETIVRLLQSFVTCMFTNIWACYSQVLEYTISTLYTHVCTCVPAVFFCVIMIIYNYIYIHVGFHL